MNYREKEATVCEDFALGRICQVDGSTNSSQDTSVFVGSSHDVTVKTAVAAHKTRQDLAVKLLNAIRPATQPSAITTTLSAVPLPQLSTPPGLLPPPGLAFNSVNTHPSITLQPPLIPSSSVSPIVINTPLSVEDTSIHSVDRELKHQVPVQINANGDDEAVAREESVKDTKKAKANAAAATHAHAHSHRIVQCMGQLVVATRDGRSGRDAPLAHNHALRPNSRLSVHYSLADTVAAGVGGDLVIGLLRLAAPSNRHAIVTKPLPGSDRGSLFFFAPKAAGHFVFRLFRSSDPSITLAFSSAFNVVLGEQELEAHLHFLLETFDREPPSLSCQRALSQASSTLRCVQLRRQAVGAEVQLLGQLTTLLLGAAQTACQLSEQTKDDAADEEAEGGEEMEGDAAVGENSAEGLGERRSRRLARLHREVHDALLALATNSPLALSLAPGLRTQLSCVLGCFCPVMKRLFASPNQMHEVRVASLGCRPVTLEEGRMVPWNVVCALLDGPLTAAALRLLPPASFSDAREKMRYELEGALRKQPGFPQAGRLLLYGSSSNNFGNEDADLDMCLVQQNEERSDEKMEALIRQLSHSLEQLGMSDVQTRPSARIPIVLFRHPNLNYDGDISVHNPLALANTRLLRAYSEVDHRVRLLVYVVKHWARARQMNSPSNGTLSSYGYILTIIFFLQRRPVPLLPSLQLLSPHWSGPRADSIPSRQDRAWGEVPLSQLPSVLEKSAADGGNCNVYFLDAQPQQKLLLQHLASRNKETLAELLLAYFQFFAWQFDFSQHVVQIRFPGNVAIYPISATIFLMAILHHSIEDPLETWYDVAHVIKPPQMAYIRKEFLRAYTLASRIGAAGTASDFLSELFTPCEVPAFRPHRTSNS
eukprot:gene25581-30890_t